MCWLFAISISLLGYVYIGYPLLIWILSRLSGRPEKSGHFEDGCSILIVAHNEAGTLPQKMQDLLDLAKNEPIREICLGLDGCTDETGERVRERIEISNIQYSMSNVQSLPRQWHGGGEPRTEIGDPKLEDPSPDGPRPIVHILEFKSQRGKAAVLNDLMKTAQQPIWVMMDARQRVEAGAIPNLLCHFADPQVGVVSGALVYESAEGGAQKGAQSYWGYERFIRQCESHFWAVPGATGALYAIRQELCLPIPENTLVDDVLIPMRAVLGGYRCLFEPSSQVFDLPSTDFKREGLRKRRTLAGIWQLCHLEPQIFSFFANPIAFQWYSHKILRLLTPIFLFLLLLSSAVWGFRSDNPVSWGRILFWALTAGLGLSGSAYAGGRILQSRFLGLLGAFWGVNWALILAAWDALRGRFESRWKAG